MAEELNSPEFSSDEPALSLRPGPLRSLFDKLRETKAPVTIVCGAGISRDANLPTWNELVNSMCNEVPEELCERIKLDPTEPMRKVDHILRLRRDKNRGVDEIVRDHLYARPPSPGRLAYALANLCYTLRSRVRVVTTNFDLVLEMALLSHYSIDNIVPFGLFPREGEADPTGSETNYADRVDALLKPWLEIGQDKEKIGVLHLHGMVAPSPETSSSSEFPSTVGKIVLSESRFLELGEIIQEVMRRILRESHVIFVGISMTDPNVVGPLGRTRQERGTHGAFMLLPHDDRVEPPHPRTDEDDLWIRYRAELDKRDQYVGSRVEALDAALGLQTTLLKSFSQVQQAIIELNLSLLCSKEYFDRSRSASLRYGYRLNRALERSYRAAGIRGRRDFPDTVELSQTHERLCMLFKDEVAPVLRELRRSVTKTRRAKLNILGLNDDFFEEEVFALFVWLRCRYNQQGLKQHIPYAISLVGTSAYVHTAPETFRTIIGVESRVWPAAECLYAGRGEVHSFEEGDQQNMLWKSIWTLPLVWRNPRILEDELLVGAVTLNATRRTYQPDVLNRPGMQPSLLSFQSARYTRKLNVALTNAGTKLISLT